MRIKGSRSACLLPPYEVVIDHPELARYHAGWGRPGDLAVPAEAGDQVVGGAFCRLFTEEDHGYGFVDERTPELAVAVWDGHRGSGIGTALLAALEAEAAHAGIDRLSLSVEAANPARRLSARAGYVEVSLDESGACMVKDLGGP